ncbi:MAG: hypothetical protein L3J18_10095 [Candidatus Brocadia sp.]|uniref:Uncharacterized protein n=1 Tax=Candidatus Brocadia fulgida TaxID=380242 RepID=A0A0M2UQM8_9BACT|nr:MAG: hypothetical protein BROFUL_03358 [Candidatus Brocadia fulgida]UJS19270.1 MAG: hypothetical protein L3J18_10095 [Candidatus Brocadia sp.]
MSKQIPEIIEGHPTCVIKYNSQTPPVEVPADVRIRDIQNNWQRRNQRFETLVGGIAVWNSQFKHECQIPGTLGAIVFHAATSQFMGLSNYHVLVLNKQGKAEGKKGDTIMQGNFNEYPPNRNNSIGTLFKWNKKLDCAICALRDYSEVGEILDCSKRPQGAISPLVGMKVIKSGMATGLTRGIVDGVSRTDKSFTVIPDPGNPSPTGEISTGGNSGSVWLEFESFCAVGLHYDGEKNSDPGAERAWAKQMTEVAKELEIEFTTGITEIRV